MPVRTAPYSTGSTIRKLMSTESDAPRTHTSARMMKLATGVALTSCSTGASSTSAACHACAAAARNDADYHAQPEAQQDASGAETHPLPELCLRQKLQKGAQRLHRRNKEHLLSHGHGSALPHRQPEGRSAQPLKKLFMSLHKLTCS